jgi:hypothetical protein
MHRTKGLYRAGCWAPAGLHVLVPSTPEETAMAKNKGGREAKKPKQAHNKKQKGQTPAPSSTLTAINGQSAKK